METINGATYYPPVDHDAYMELIMGRNETMKITIKELIEKIDAINLVIEELHKLPQSICDDAENYLKEYVDMLEDIKVDI